MDRDSVMAMPGQKLRRGNLRPLMRILIPVVPSAMGLLGLNYFLMPAERIYASPTFTMANDIMPMQYWGGGFMLVAGLLIYAMIVGSKPLYEQGLAAVVGVQIIWSLVFLTAAVAGLSSFTAWVWPAFAGTVALGMIKELTTRGGQHERSPN